jgi:NAD(P)-dependent dehydrogenase (short-subunit alcohol dehydrogenase family)
MDRLKGKVAFITGSGSGIGRAAAVLFARESARAAVADISRAGSEETVRMASEAGCDAVYVETDVTDPVSAERAIKSVAGWWARLDVLYNNAGGSTAHNGEVTEVSVEE